MLRSYSPPRSSNPHGVLTTWLLASVVGRLVSSSLYMLIKQNIMGSNLLRASWAKPNLVNYHTSHYTTLQLHYRPRNYSTLKLYIIQSIATHSYTQFYCLMIHCYSLLPSVVAIVNSYLLLIVQVIGAPLFQTPRSPNS